MIKKKRQPRISPDHDFTRRRPPLGYFALSSRASQRKAHTRPRANPRPRTVFFFKQKTAYEISTRVEFRRVLFRSGCSFARGESTCHFFRSSKRGGRRH